MKNVVNDSNMFNKDQNSSFQPNKPRDGTVLRAEEPNLENVQANKDKPIPKLTKLRTKLRNRQSLKNKDKNAHLKKRHKERSPSPNPVEKSPKCVSEKQVVKEVVPEVPKKEEEVIKVTQPQSVLFSLFKRSTTNESERPLTPKKEIEPSVESLGNVEKPNKEETGPYDSNSIGDRAQIQKVGFNEEYENNYRSNGIRAEEAEMNRQKKLMENRGLLKETNTEKKKNRDSNNAVMLRSATRKIHSYVLNKPKSANIPHVMGRYPVLIATTFIIIFVFLGQLVLNKVSFNGRCVSKVLYPEASLGKRPYHVIFGYGACEYNVQQKAETIGFLGSTANDKGWPSQLVSDEAVVESSASFDSPNSRVFNLFGSLDANYIRNYNETFRLFWSMFMHKGLLHLMFNLLAQSQILWIIEPDWGFIRTSTTFLISGLVGNLAAAVFEPSFNVLGSSGCLFGMMASLIPYCIENWTLLTSPIYILVFAVAITLISLSVFTTTVSIYSHFGGWLGGLLWGFATLRSNFNLKECAIKESLLLSPLFSSKLTPEAKNKIKNSYHNKQMTCVNKIRVQNKDKSFSKKIRKMYMYPIEYFKRGPYDILIRIVPLTILVVILVFLFCYLYIESLYSKMFPLDEKSKLSQCCYLYAKSEGNFAKRVFWCFETYQTAQILCEKK